MSEENSWLLEYFNKVGAKCNVCNSFYGRNYDYMKRHLFKVHNIRNNEDILRWKNDTNDRIWQYYSKQDGYMAQCKVAHCKVLFSTCKYNKLIKHLYKHQEIVHTVQQEITSSWLSQYCKLKNVYATCKYCDYRVNIFKEIDFLKSHLDKRHNINKNSGCKEKTGDNDADEMAGQSINKNNASPSSDRNNLPRQPLENQEGQQSLTQQSVNEEICDLRSHNYI